MSTREAARTAMAGVASRRNDVICLDSDTGHLGDLFEDMPRQYINLGIAEANLMSVAAGMASTGKTVFVNTMAAFASARAAEQVKIDIAANRLSVKILATHGGLSAGHFGATHWATEDIAIMRAFGAMTVIVPSDDRSVARLVRQSADYPGPVYIRLGRNPTPDVYRDQDLDSLVIGRAVELRSGADVTIVAAGGHPLVIALEAHAALASDGVAARVIDAHTIKPIDRAAIIAAASETGGIVTVEDHSVLGGLGGAVAEVVTDERPCRVVRVGISDASSIRTVGSELDLLGLVGVTTAAVVSAAHSIVAEGRR